MKGILFSKYWLLNLYKLEINLNNTIFSLANYLNLKFELKYKNSTFNILIYIYLVNKIVVLLFLCVIIKYFFTNLNNHWQIFF